MISSSVTTPTVVSDAADSDQKSEVLLPHSAGQNPSAPKTGALVVEVIGKIIAMSQRLFPGSVSIDYSYDPENPTDEYLIFDVVAHGEYADFRDREFEWHQQVRKIVPGSLGEFRLSVTPQR
jgi:hypothetical protein